MSSQAPCYSVAIIGLGAQGYSTWFEHLRQSSTIKVSAVCDTSTTAIDDFTSLFPEIPGYTNLEQLLQHHQDKLSFAIVCVPNRHHFQVIKQLSAAGVACLKEKPIAESLEEYSNLRCIPTKVAVAFQRRWQPRFIHFRSLLPMIGSPLSIRARLVGKYDPPSDGWRMMDNVGTFVRPSFAPFDDLGVHMLDVITWLFGRPTTVLGHRANDHLHSARDRESHVVMRWDSSGLVGHLYVSEVEFGKSETVQVRGDRGSLHLNCNEIIHYDSHGRQTFQTVFQSRKEDTIQNICQQFGEYIQGVQESFSTSIAQVEDTLVTAEAICTSFLSNNLESVPPTTEYKNGSKTMQLSPSLNGDAGHPDKNASTNGHKPCSKTNGHSKNGNGTTDTNFTRLCFTLNTGDKMPGLGFGTRKPKAPMQTYEAVMTALRLGYRHIDTAFRYNNEDQVGKAVRDSGLARDTVWITTKVDNSWHHRVAESVRLSIERLGTEYIDLLLMHWPSPVKPEDPTQAMPDWDFIKTWQDMQREVQAGRIRNIGVSNFGIRNLTKLLSHPQCTIVPAVNQIELHPCCPSNELLAFCELNDIHCTAYSPLASGLPELHENVALRELCERKGRTPQQILIMWALQRGTSVIPKSVKAERIASNFDLNGWNLTPDEHKLLSNLEVRCRVYPDDWLPERVFWEEDD
ncbi:NADP-dependent oxidoreductase domain-containing protein [Mariannaea sp. PMI_226]|nr:NADP-dependent oxidoreductase domain-containing protein [Mariannaea sp. PMI_226]